MPNPVSCFIFLPNTHSTMLLLLASDPRGKEVNQTCLYYYSLLASDVLWMKGHLDGAGGSWTHIDITGAKHSLAVGM